ncbi:uncharacterized protein [Macrobrachium rosenbergii]|uniref:uncharacterized protein isoform X3 n=1 Tax=Macrobrachium rosenbergii TaxID=79674 RepID=UPI0034D6C3EA
MDLTSGSSKIQKGFQIRFHLAVFTMPRNVEIKARVNNVKELHKRAAELSSSEGSVLEQEDTFYNSPQGRLKLRVIKIECTNGFLSGDMNKLLSRCLGQRGHVSKTRTLYLVGQTRVHVDSVDNLGDFMELEVVLNDDQTLEEGEKIARDLQQKLGISENDLCSEAYMDMILKK